MIHLAATLLLLSTTAAAPADSYDVIVYGGSPAGVMAAVEAARLGKSVLLIEPGRHLGGLLSGGRVAGEPGQPGAIGGLSREFYLRVAEEYRRQVPAPKPPRGAAPVPLAPMYAFEPHVAEKVFNDLVREAHVNIVFQERLDLKEGVGKQQARIEWIRMESGRQLHAKMFLDCSYEGDLMAKAGVSYAVGREAIDAYGETLAGIQPRRPYDQFNLRAFSEPIDPYLTPGQPGSGLLPGIGRIGWPGKQGTADRLIPAYTCRAILTAARNNQVPIARPDRYDPLRYELAARYIACQPPDHLGALLGLSALPGGKLEIHCVGPLSIDCVGLNTDYLEAGYAARARIVQAHKDYVLGYLWFLGNDRRVPEAIRAQMQSLGLARDEYADNVNWPYLLDMGETRRMVAEAMVTELHRRGEAVVRDAVGLASTKPVDFAMVQRFVDASGHVANEGGFQVPFQSAVPISYRAIVPRKEQCVNLLVPVCISASHVGYNALDRTVPMVLGQSAAAAACLAIERELAVQDLPFPILAEQLAKDGQRF